jgi:hypothetical protein
LSAECSTPPDHQKCGRSLFMRPVTDLLLLAWLGQLRRIGIEYQKSKTEVLIGTMRTDRSMASGRVHCCADVAFDRVVLMPPL